MHFLSPSVYYLEQNTFNIDRTTKCHISDKSAACEMHGK